MRTTYQEAEKQILATFYGVQPDALDLPYELWMLIRNGHATKYSGAGGAPAPPAEPTVTVDAAALRQVLEALVGPHNHLIPEPKTSAKLSSGPVKLLIDQYNEQVGK